MQVKERSEEGRKISYLIYCSDYKLLSGSLFLRQTPKPIPSLLFTFTCKSGKSGAHLLSEQEAFSSCRHGRLLINQSSAPLLPVCSLLPPPPTTTITTQTAAQGQDWDLVVQLRNSQKEKFWLLDELMHLARTWHGFTPLLKLHVTDNLTTTPESRNRVISCPASLTQE